MAQNNITADTAKMLGIDMHEAENLQLAMVKAIKAYCMEMDAVAIPGFGTFIPEKKEEYVDNDAQTGKCFLVPPSIVLKWHPSIILRKQFVS